MPLKFLTLAISACCVLTRLVPAQTPSPTPPAYAYVRFWDMLPSGNGDFHLLTGKDSQTPFAVARAYQYSGYLEIPVGKTHLVVTKAGNSAPIKAFDVDLKADNYFTVLVAPQHVDLIEDSENPKEHAGTVTIRNFFPDSTVTVVRDKVPITRALAYGQTFAVTALPLERVTLTLHGILPNALQAESSLETEFKKTKRATILIVPDSYGRFRPRMILDGTNS